MKGRESMQKIKMSNPTNLTLNQAFEMYLKKMQSQKLIRQNNLILQANQ